MPSLAEPEPSIASRPRPSPEAIEEMRASIRAYIEGLPRHAKLVETPAPPLAPAVAHWGHFKQAYRSKGKGRGKRIKIVTL
jgi:hypothetical protein